jgi:hypothetical protein
MSRVFLAEETRLSAIEEAGEDIAGYLSDAAELADLERRYGQKGDQALDGHCGVCGLYDMATIYDRQGKADSALASYDRLITHPTTESLTGFERYALAPSDKRLGELYEGKGDRKKAADYYGRFVELWKKADPPLQSAVKEVRERLARLAIEQ